MTYTKTIAFITLLSLSVLACGSSSGDTGDTSDDTGEAATAAETNADATDAATSGDEPTTVDPPATSSETSSETTADASTSAESTSDPTGGVADCGFDPAVTFERLATIYQLVSEDGETCVWLERRDDSEPDTIYKAVPFTLLELKAGHAGTVAHLTDDAKMTWESTHHNWSDIGEAWDDSVRYRLEDWYSKDFVIEFGLSAYDEATDELLWGPVRLIPFTP